MEAPEDDQPPARHWRWPTRFSRSTLTSLFTTAVDFLTLVTAVQVFGVNYVLATWMGTVVGSLSNFSINRKWAFGDSIVRSHNQFLRFVLVQAGSSGLNTLGVWLLTRFLRVPYPISRLIVAGIVAVGWNYPMNHFVVFATSRSPPRA
ncbi:MAG TPA: GtrA family protein [Polyangia bacterium]|jgi:putative flippase GtrA|nr:GtrA family protein [Polyangia bacterium]